METMPEQGQIDSGVTHLIAEISECVEHPDIVVSLYRIPEMLLFVPSCELGKIF
jgi:hypothetical protein